MTWLIYFISGWFGKYWWPGRDVDAPQPGNPDPWWMRLIIGIIAGGIAVYVVGAVAMTDTMSAMVLSIATGCVVGKVLGSLTGMMRAK